MTLIYILKDIVEFIWYEYMEQNLDINRKKCAHCFQFGVNETNGDCKHDHSDKECDICIGAM